MVYEVRRTFVHCSDGDAETDADACQQQKLSRSKSDSSIDYGVPSCCESCCGREGASIASTGPDETGLDVDLGMLDEEEAHFNRPPNAPTMMTSSTASSSSAAPSQPSTPTLSPATTPTANGYLAAITPWGLLPVLGMPMAATTPASYLPIMQAAPAHHAAAAQQPQHQQQHQQLQPQQPVQLHLNMQLQQQQQQHPGMMQQQHLQQQPASLLPSACSQFDPDALERAAADLMQAAIKAKAAARRARGLPVDEFSLAEMLRQGDDQSSRPNSARSGTMASQASRSMRDVASNESQQVETRTTVMVRNLPLDYTREHLLDLLDSQGFRGCYNFAYFPMDFRRWAGFGYAFVNMVSAEEALRIRRELSGFCEWKVPSVKVVEVCWGDPLQGFEACVERYRNSPIMHESVPDVCKPAIFVDGYQQPFPEPTKKLSEPTWKMSGKGLSGNDEATGSSEKSA